MQQEIRGIIPPLVTPFREVLCAGTESIEQFERLSNGSRPFYRRWTTGEGLAQPYTLVADVNGTYGVNGKTEFVRFQAQVSKFLENMGTVDNVVQGAMTLLLQKDIVYNPA